MPAAALNPPVATPMLMDMSGDAQLPDLSGAVDNPGGADDADSSQLAEEESPVDVEVLQEMEPETHLPVVEEEDVSLSPEAESVPSSPT